MRQKLRVISNSHVVQIAEEFSVALGISQSRGNNLGCGGRSRLSNETDLGMSSNYYLCDLEEIVFPFERHLWKTEQ
jgi:hypothetical protein